MARTGKKQSKEQELDRGVSANTEQGDACNDEIRTIIRADELGKKGEALYEYAVKFGYREAIIAAQEIAGNNGEWLTGVMSDEALEAINALDDEIFAGKLQTALNTDENR